MVSRSYKLGASIVSHHLAFLPRPGVDHGQRAEEMAGVGSVLEPGVHAQRAGPEEEFVPEVQRRKHFEEKS
jgi:hypothetical protein